MAESYHEHLVQLGDDQHLVAAMTIPLKTALRALQSQRGQATSDQTGASMGVVLLNAGVIHRIGPHRINVKLARRLAKAGIPSVRLDLSGLGDSRRAGGTDAMLVQVSKDIRCALDALATRTGVQRFVIVGICSGAEYGYQYAEHDARVAGVVMVDGYSFGNWKTKCLRYGLRLGTLTWPVLKQAVLGRIRRWRKRNGDGAATDTPVDYGLPSITVEAFAQGLSSRVRRGCQVYLVYTGSILHRYNHASQFQDVMGKLPLNPADKEALAAVQCDFLPQMDHTLSTLEGQRLFISRVSQWLSERVQKGVGRGGDA